MTTSLPHLSHPKYRPDIDGLRAVAVLAVVAFHAFPAWMKGGFIGVDVFFVISGFLISTIIFENLDKGTFNFAEFYARRIKRIFPALLLVLIASYVFGWFVLLADEYKQLGKHIAAGAGFVSNFVLWSEAGYFDNSAETKPLLHLWSLGVEEQFYIVWPLIIWFAWKQKFNLLMTIVIVAFLSYFLNLNEVEQKSVATFYSPQTRFWELLCGSALAWFVLYQKTAYTNVKLWVDDWLTKAVCRERIEADGKMLSNVLSFFGCFILAYGFWRISKEVSFPGKWAVVPVVGAVLIILAGPTAWINKKLLSNKVAVWFGLISFPLYLWHWPLLSFARIVEGETPSRNARIVAIVLSVILAWLTCKLIERPIRLGGRSKEKVIALVFLMIGVGFVGYNTYSRDGLKFRSVVKAEAFNSVAFEWPNHKKEMEQCLKEISPFNSDYCMISNELPLRVALVGDSHANALYDFAKDYYAQRGMGVIQLGKGGCPPLLNVERDSSGCPNIMSDVVSYLEKNEDIASVFLVGRFAATLTGINYGGKTPLNFYSLKHIASPGVMDRAQVFEFGLREMIHRLLSAKKNVVIVLDLPELNFDPKSCLNRSVGKDCRMERSLVLERQSDYRKIISRIAFEYKIGTVDLMDAFCLGRYCYAKSEGKILYRDTHHLGVWGSEYLHQKNFNLD